MSDALATLHQPVAPTDRLDGLIAAFGREGAEWHVIECIACARRNGDRAIEAEWAGLLKYLRTDRR